MHTPTAWRAMIPQVIFIGEFTTHRARSQNLWLAALPLSLGQRVERTDGGSACLLSGLPSTLLQQYVSCWASHSDRIHGNSDCRRIRSSLTYLDKPLVSNRHVLVLHVGILCPVEAAADFSDYSRARRSHLGGTFQLTLGEHKYISSLRTSSRAVQ